MGGVHFLRGCRVGTSLIALGSDLGEQGELPLLHSETGAEGLEPGSAPLHCTTASPGDGGDVGLKLGSIPATHFHTHCNASLLLLRHF